MKIFGFNLRFRLTKVPTAIAELTEAATVAADFIVWTRQRFGNDEELVKRANNAEMEISEAVAAVKAIWK